MGFYVYTPKQQALIKKIADKAGLDLDLVMGWLYEGKTTIAELVDMNI